MLKYIGANIKNARMKAGLTQEELAERMDVSVSCISRWETGRAMISIPALVSIARELNISASELMMEPSATQLPFPLDRPAYIRETDSSDPYGSPAREISPTDLELIRMISDLSAGEKEFLRDTLHRYRIYRKKMK